MRRLSLDGSRKSRSMNWQKILRNGRPVPPRKIFFITSLLCGGSSVLVYFLTQKMFSRTSYYQLALEHLRGHTGALEALGTPLRVHYLHLTDRHNFVDIADAKLKIPVSGPKAEGEVYVFSSRKGPFTSWQLQEVFLKLKDGQQIPLFKLSEETDVKKA